MKSDEEERGGSVPVSSISVGDAAHQFHGISTASANNSNNFSPASQQEIIRNERPPRPPPVSSGGGINGLLSVQEENDADSSDSGVMGEQKSSSMLLQPELQPVFRSNSLIADDPENFGGKKIYSSTGIGDGVMAGSITSNASLNKAAIIEDILPNVVNNFNDPLETEAENAILRAIENKQQGMNGIEDIGASLLSRAIPPNDRHTVDLFTKADYLDGSATKPVDIEKLPKEASEKEAAEEMTSLLQKQQKGSKLPIVRTDVTISGVTFKSSQSKKTIGGGLTTIKTLEKQQSNLPRVISANNQKQTVVETLVDTGELLKQFQIGENPRKSSAEYNIGIQDSNRTDIMSPAPASGDRFVRNAAMLEQVGGGIDGRKRTFDQHNDTKDEEGDHGEDNFGENDNVIDIENQKNSNCRRCLSNLFCFCKRGANNKESQGPFFGRTRNSMMQTSKQVKDQALNIRDFFKPKQETVRRYCLTVVKLVFIPALIISLSLFYANNPVMCSGVASQRNPDDCSTISWFIIFLVRHTITFSIALVTEMFVIGYLFSRSRFMVNLFGPKVTLLIVGSRGWPFILFVWSMLDLFLLAGGNKFVNHWLYWQHFMPLFNDNNPAGAVTNNYVYYSFLVVGVVVSILTSFKRFFLGLYFGQKTYQNYSKQLAKIMQDMLALSLIAKLAHDCEVFSANASSTPESLGVAKGGRDEVVFGWDDKNALTQVDSVDEAEAEKEESVRQSPGGLQSKAASLATFREDIQSTKESSDPATSGVDIDKSFNRSELFNRSTELSSTKAKLNELLGEWEEPTYRQKHSKYVSISEILRFRQALAFMDDIYPFSVYFGPANKRDKCAESAEKVYASLLKRTPEQRFLPFDTLALVAVDHEGNVDHKWLRRLRKMFRPNQDGNLTPLDFVRSCDTVYKDIRLFRANMANSSQIDESFETIIKIFYYIVLLMIILSIFGVNTHALFLSISSFIVGFAFMVGKASSLYFEGVLFVLARRPYDIGDRIHVSNPQQDSSPNGSPGWFVESVDLFTTTVRFATTNEVATYNNGYLASSRIINGARSPNAIVYVYLKFDTDVPKAKIQIFQKTIEEFVTSRPRQWLKFSGFRATRIETELSYIEYVIVAQHVEPWQNMLPIVTSKAELASYCLELTKQLDIKYTAPELPVTIDMKGQDQNKDMLFRIDSSAAEKSHLGGDASS